MRKHLHLLLAALLGGILPGCGPTGGTSVRELEAGFASPPDSVQTAVYWYWIADHISQEGIVADLHAMKKAGINRAFIGNIWVDGPELAGGQVPFGSEEWWQALHTALKTATELDIEIGIFNSPGWSQSGGPWIEPGQAMRYLASATAVVTGGREVIIDLPAPHPDFQDVRTVAYPLPGGTGIVSPVKSSAVSTDAGPATEYLFDAPQIIRSVKIAPHHRPVNTSAQLQVYRNGAYVTVSDFRIERYNDNPNVGFDPYAPIVVSLPLEQTDRIRLVTDAPIESVEFHTRPLVERYPEKTLAKMHQTPLPYWHEYQWPEQPLADQNTGVVPAAQVIEVSDYLQGDHFRWSAPQGEWMIVRTGMVPTGTINAPASPEATGREVDKMSREHTQAHFEAFMGEVIRRIPEEDRRSWKVVVQDSYETGGQNFTDDFMDAFRVRYGYDPLPFLPVYSGTVVESPDISDRFLWDVRRLVADRVAYEYVGGLRDIAHRYGLRTWLENYGHWGFPAEFLQYGGQSDEIGGEFWAVGTLGDIENRAASSCGHIYGKTKIWAESFTSAPVPFADYPALLKPRGDRFFAEGINSTLLHLYIHQPYEDRVPGINAWFGTEFNRHNTWFAQMDLFTDYLKRINMMLQQGTNVADVAYFIGEDAPKMTGITEPALPPGYQFDYINAEVILRDMFVRDGLLTLPHGTQYRMLVLPPSQTMRPELLEKIQQLIADGGTVMGPAPKRSPSYQDYPRADRRVAELAAQMWEGLSPREGETEMKGIGKGRLLSGDNMYRAMELIGCLPDFDLSGDRPIHYGHRTTSEAEIYFVANQSDERQTFTARFRVSGLHPEWWDPVSGTTRSLPDYTRTETGIEVPMRLEPYQSGFVVFTRRKPSNMISQRLINFPDPVEAEALPGPWQVTLTAPDGKEAAAFQVQLLEDLSLNSDPAVRHFSGTALYRTTFDAETLPAGKKFLSVENLSVMARVRINGRDAGGMWTLPYRVEITDLVQPGENTVEIEAVTTWVNRLIGDAALPPKERTAWTAIDTWGPDSPLHKSGVSGAVRIEVY